MPEEVLSAEIRFELQRMEDLEKKYYHTVTWYRKYMNLSFILQYVVIWFVKSIINTNCFSGCPNGHPYAVGDVRINVKESFTTRSNEKKSKYINFT